VGEGGKKPLKGRQPTKKKTKKKKHAEIHRRRPHVLEEKAVIALEKIKHKQKGEGKKSKEREVGGHLTGRVGILPR